MNTFDWMVVLAIIFFFWAFFLGKGDPRLTAAVMVAFLFCMGGVWLEGERASNGKPIELRKLPPKTEWRALTEKSLENENWVTFLQNTKTKHIVAVTSREKLPEHFKTRRTGWWFWKKTLLVPVDLPLEAEEPEEEKEKK